MIGINQFREEPLVRLLDLRILALDCTLPLVWRDDELKLKPALIGGILAFGDELDNAWAHAKEPGVVRATLVQPLQGAPAFLAELLGEPDDDASVKPGGVRQELSEVVVIGVTELVLDDDGVVGAGRATEDVRGEVADRLLRVFGLDLDAKGG